MKVLDQVQSTLNLRARFNPHVAIVGAGFSGTLLAINLLRQPGVDVTLIERRKDRIGRGVAYSAEHQHHVLNVRASGMSAFADLPDDFVHWLARHGVADAHAFVSRSLYGNYLEDKLAAALATDGRRLTICQDDVLDLAETNGGVSLGMASGALVTADRAVLAVGNLPPHDPPGVSAARLQEGVYWSDPWAHQPEVGLDSDQPVLLLGSGLTAIDVILRLADRGFSGPIVALSRRGLRPHGHRPELPRPAPQLSKPAEHLSELVRWARDRTMSEDWRQTVDSLRPITQLMWSSADLHTRARFLRHLRPYWDIHRHRLSPQVHAKIAALVESGQLKFAAGKVVSLGPASGGAELTWRPRGHDNSATISVQRIFNCTGPQGDLLRTTDPLLCKMLKAGMIRPDTLRLGLDVDRLGRVINRSGTAHEAIRAVGPISQLKCKKFAPPMHLPSAPARNSRANIKLLWPLIRIALAQIPQSPSLILAVSQAKMGACR